LPAITATVDAFLHNVGADERINARFAGADLPDLRQKLIDQVCQATGGPCTYNGRDMITAHRGMNIQSAEFDALVSDLQQALASLKVPDKEQGELLGALGGMRSQIVDNGVGAPPAAASAAH
jgi:hemoglobin